MKTNRQNALHNCKNGNQGHFKKVLVVCSAGLLRSATTAWVLGNQTDFNVRNCGVHDYALIRYDEVLHEWADEIIFMEDEHVAAAQFYVGEVKTPYHVLNVPDIYPYRHPDLVKLVNNKLKDIYGNDVFGPDRKA